MLSTANINLVNQSRQATKKLSHKYVGPYKITEKISPVAYKLQLPETLKNHPVFHMSLLKRFHENPPDFEERVSTPSPPVMTDEGLQYEVERILDKRFRRIGRGTRVEYLVKWLGYDETEATWKPTSNLNNAQELVTEYEEQANKEGGHS
ncbi:uncharacterized protein VTP21DRAFT_11362 [Calcarisporiella thermophila]|uniref:uncharacterized protein n=1 Tax=Calcarisporiella thermophila TaxID=911321 RepID=UPI00374300AA